MGHMRSTATRFGCFQIIYSASDSTFASFKRALHNTNTTIPSPSALSFSQLVHNLKSNEPPSSRPFDDIRLLNCLLFSINSSKNLGNCPPVVAWFKRILDSVDSQSILFNYLLPLQALMASWSVIPGSAVDGSRAVVMKADASSFVSHLELDISSSTSSPSSFSTSPFVSALESAITRFPGQSFACSDPRISHVFHSHRQHIVCRGAVFPCGTHTSHRFCQKPTKIHSGPKLYSPHE